MAAQQPLHAGELVRVRGERWRIARRIPYDGAAILEVDGCDTANRGERARFLLPFEPLDRLPVSCAPRVVRPARWRRVARGALAAASPPAASLRAATGAALTLIPFQLEPALALSRGDGCRFLIADAVGMGKTVQAGLMVAETLQRRPDGRILIVAPAGLREQWRDELRGRFRLDAAVLDAAAVARRTLDLPASINPWSVERLVITSIDYLKRPEVIRCHEALIWDLVVFDEAHGLAGRSDRSEAAQAVGRRARTLVMLTATPHSGDEEAFRRMCAIGELHDGHPLLLFRRTRGDAGVAARRTSLLRVRPTPAEATMHDALLEYARVVWTQSAGTASPATAPGARLAMSVLMRRACSSAASLARSIERRIACLADPSPAEAVQPGLPLFDGESEDEEPRTALGTPGMHEPAGEHAHLARLLHLARAATRAESKLLALRRLLRRIQEPVIVFTEYRDTLQQVASELRDIDAVHLHGGLRQQERAEALRRFTSGPARLLLATDAASEGLNLHHRCRVVINLELPWTPLRLEQRAGRVDRIGQPRRVHALHLVAAGTSEETVLATLDRRVSRMEQAIDALARLPGEREIAECVIAGRPLPGPAAAASSAAYPGIAVVDLSPEALREAARISAARTLLPRSDISTAEARPVIAHLRRHRPLRELFRLKPEATPDSHLFRLKPEDTPDGHPFRLKPEATHTKAASSSHVASGFSHVTSGFSHVTSGRSHVASGRLHVASGRLHVASGFSRKECFWLFQLIFTGADGRVLWESAVALGAPAPGVPARSNAITRSLLDPDQPALRPITEAMKDEQLHAVRLMLRRPARLWLARERALIDALRTREARLSAGLLQLALFDRRDERAAAAQSALLEEALAASATRVAELTAATDPRIDSCRLVFGAFLE